MIDIHSHILPSIDDGARSIKEALTMLEMAIEQGVTTQVLTPHIQMGRYDNNQQSIESAFTQFKLEVNSAKLPIKLLLAAECHIGPQVMQLATQNAIPCLGEYQGKKTFLLEFPRTDVPFGSDNLVKWLITKNYLPVIVHPERNSTFLNNRSKLQTFIDLGCPLQITASSITGKFGSNVKEMCVDLLNNNQVNAIASDCHNLKGRKPDLLDGVKAAQNIIGEEKAHELVNKSALALINNNVMYS